MHGDNAAITHLLLLYVLLQIKGNTLQFPNELFVYATALNSYYHMVDTYFSKIISCRSF